MYVSGFSLHIHLLGRAPIPASTPKILILHTHNCKTQLISRLICRSGIGPKYHAAPTKTNFNKISNISERGASRTPLDAYDTPPRIWSLIYAGGARSMRCMLLTN